MRQKGFASLVAMVATAFLVSACGSDDGVKFEKKTLSFLERDTDEFGFVDAPPKTTLGIDGPKRVSNGDQATSSDKLLDASKKHVGDLDIHCAVVRASGGFDTSSNVCTGVMTLPGGSLTLTLGGKVFQQGASVKGAVVGGSGGYAGATGSFTSTQSDPSTDTITLFVPKE